MVLCAGAQSKIIVAFFAKKGMIGDNIVRGGQRRAFQQEEIIMDGMKNISKAEVLTLRDQVAYQSSGRQPHAGAERARERHALLV